MGVARCCRVLWAALSVLGVTVIYVEIAIAQHGDGCACGVPQNSPAFFEIDFGAGSVFDGSVEAIEKFNVYANVFSWGAGDEFGGRNGKNEIVGFTAAQALSVYGMSVSANTLGFAYLSPQSAFGSPSFNACPAPSGTTCGFFGEMDVVMNSSFSGGWTTAPPEYNNSNPAYFGATALHEFGHVLGLHHNFDSLSTMNYYEGFAQQYLSRGDANIVRIHYPALANTVTDLATFPFRFDGYQWGGTTVASAAESVVEQGDQFTLRNFTVENLGSTSPSDVRLQIYLSSNTVVSQFDYLVGTVYWSTFSTWWDVDSGGRVFNVPSTVPPGDYYIGGILLYDDTVTDDVAYNNSWVLDDARRITVTAAPLLPDLITIDPSVSGTTLLADEVFTVSATVQNVGEQNATGTVLNYYQSTNSIISTADSLIGTETVASLGAGGSVIVSQEVTAPNVSGDYWIGACVDPVVDESPISNQCSTGVLVTVFQQSTETCNNLPVTVDLNLGETPTPASDVILGTDGDDIIRGKAGDDTICGMGGNDYIHGNSGNDWIDGGDGVDDIRGGQGDDVLYTGRGATFNTLSKAFGGHGSDEINGGPDADDLRGGRDADTIRGYGGDDVLYGNEGVDILYGGNGYDTIKGGNGDDELRGGGDDDVLNGGGDNDVLVGGAGESDYCDGGNGDMDSETGSCETITNIP